MAEKERAEFNSGGIFTVTQLSYTFRPRHRPKELKDKRKRHHHSLKARAIREGKIYIVGSPKMQIEGTPVYLDVEGLPDRDFYYLLIGIRVRTADSTVQHSFWADSPSDEGRIWQEFLLKLAEVEKPILIHYGSFESIFLKRMRERHGAPPDGISAGKAMDSPINLLSVIFGQIYFPTHSNRLKEIAGWLEFKWSEQEASGLQAIIWRHDWEQTRNPLVKEELVRFYRTSGLVIRKLSFATDDSRARRLDGVRHSAIVARVSKVPLAHAKYLLHLISWHKLCRRVVRGEPLRPQGRVVDGSSQ